MKKSEIFLKAAERIEQGMDLYACTAIDSAQIKKYGLWSPATQWFQKEILPKGNKSFPYFDSSDGIFLRSREELRNARIVALCFAAAIAEDEE